VLPNKVLVSNIFRGHVLNLDCADANLARGAFWIRDRSVFGLVLLHLLVHNGAASRMISSRKTIVPRRVDIPSTKQ